MQFTCYKNLSLRESNKITLKKLLYGIIYNSIKHTHLLLLATILFSVSCSPTRRIPEGEYLLNKTSVEIDSKELDKKELKKYEKQSPNKTILGFKFHLFLYNLASPKREKFPSAWFRRIGEEPVIWDEILTEGTTDQYQKYLETKGYYESAIEDTVILKKKKAEIQYRVELGKPHIVNKITYKFEDQNIADLIMKDTINCLIHPGERFDKEKLQDERQRLELFMKNNGYYKFNREFIFYEAVELINEKKVNLIITVKENVTGFPDPVTKVKHHYRYKINETFVHTNFTYYNDLEDEEKQKADTIDLDKNHVIYSGKHKIRPEAVLHPNLLNPGRVYNQQDVRKSYSNYSSLGVYRIINIHFNELDDWLVDTSQYKYIDNIIELSPRKKQAYQYEIVGTNSAGDLGVRTNFLYNNYNFFRGAENFQVKLTGAIEAMEKRENFAPMKEFGIETSLTFPKFLVPFKAEQFTRKFNPRTTINISYNYQDRPDYVRTIANTSFGYKWKGNAYNLHQLIPVDFNYVRLPEGIRDQNLWNDIKDTPLRNSYEDHTILAARYVFEFSNQVIEKRRDFVYIRVNLESAGNLINGIGQMASVENDSTLFHVPYFQYLKSDVDFRFYDLITQDNRVVYRIFMGFGYPLGNSETLPFEKMYFSGGPYGIRAWSTRTLGPGSVSDTSTSAKYANNLGDIKLEANLEYRFKLFWKLEGAFFIDAGNIWTIKEYSNRLGSSFDWDRFYKEIAVGAGLGARFDFSFLLIRTDFGFKLRDPSIQEGSRWIDFNGTVDKSMKSRFVFQFGIGYPF
ncbi:MAG: BamA/TamA family outer membrane protein [Bacteroidales bacterium]|nr:BamA/TamA family outer membrane protein [Bacteroidales bacterium]